MNATTFFTFSLFLPCLKYQTYFSGLIEQKKILFFLLFLNYLVRRAFLLKARKFLVAPPQ